MPLAPHGCSKSKSTSSPEASVSSRGPKARGSDLPVAENLHRDHILDCSLVPSRYQRTSPDECWELVVGGLPA
jgi:phosphoribosylaminoimidazole carboxylase (NCAIR synthetase)